MTKSSVPPANCYYVYLLHDPRKNNIPFYVGKGKGKRALDHLKETRAKTENRQKIFTIEAIRAAGLEPTISFHATDLDEEAAYALEAGLISMLGRRNIDCGGLLTNICADNRPPKVDPEIARQNAKAFYANNPERLLEISEQVQARYANQPEVKEKISKSLKAIHENDPTLRIRMSEIRKAAHEADPTLRIRISEITKAAYEADPTLRVRIGDAVKAAYENDPTLRIRMSEITKAAYEADPTLRERVARHGEDHWNYGREMSEETRQKIGDAQRGEKNHRYGKAWSEEQKQMRRDFALKNGIRPPVQSGPQSAEKRAAISAGNLGKKRSQEVRAKNGLAKAGKRGARSPEVIAKVAKAMQASLWKRRITRALNDQFRGTELRLVLHAVKTHELLKDKIWQFRIIDHLEEAYKVNGTDDRLTIVHEGGIIKKFVIG